MKSATPYLVLFQEISNIFILKYIEKPGEASPYPPSHPSDIQNKKEKEELSVPEHT